MALPRWRFGLVLALLATLAGCIEVDNGTIVVRRQSSKTSSADKTSNATAKRAPSEASGNRDRGLARELSQLDDLMQSVGETKTADFKPSERKSRGQVLNTSFAEESESPSGSAENTAKSGTRKAPNRLGKESSPYLLLHAHNPVDWYPWGPEALAKAKQEEKLIFLSIGYTSCHWCHVMERLVFSNPDIAKLMNEHFVCIKVDREERPDIDDIYMTALSVYFRLAGSDQNGGWPLSMFLTPDAKPLAGGTYFPPEDSEGRKGFPSVMQVILDNWHSNQEQMLKNAEIITGQVRRTMSAKIALRETPLSADLVAGTVNEIAETHDGKFGGFDFHQARPNAPKFPVPSKLALLLAHASRMRDAALLGKVTLTLDKMAAGGIHDHLAGGFHRYSTDREWHVPHFEKMLYDNAQLADVYSEAFRITKNPAYRAVAEDVCDFVLRELTDKHGGFLSALDADSEEVEGKSYVWSEAEVNQLLGTDAELFQTAYGLRDQKTFEVGYVLHLPHPLEAVADKFQMTEEELSQRLAILKRKLLAARNKRPQPMCDDKILTAWNGLMIRGLANTAARLERNDYLAAAERAAMFVLSEMRTRDGRLLRSFRGGPSSVKGYLDDYANLVDGLLAIHAASQDPKWLTAAAKLTDDQLRLFEDADAGGCYFTATDHEELLVRCKDRFDSVVPSGNSVTVRNLVRLANLTKNRAYRDKAEQTLKAFATHLGDSPGGFANLALGLAEFLDARQVGSTRPIRDPDVVTASDEQPAEPKIDVAAKPKSESGFSAPTADKSNKADPKAGDPKAKEKKNEVLTAEAHLNVDRLPAGKPCRIALMIDIKEGWHINQNPAQPDYLTPTKFTMQTKLGTKLTDVKYPKGKSLKLASEAMPLMVYEGKIVLFGTLTVPEEAGGKTEEFELQLKYQACNDDHCGLPKTLKLAGKVEIAAAGEPVKSINDKLFNPPKQK